MTAASSGKAVNGGLGASAAPPGKSAGASSPAGSTMKGYATAGALASSTAQQSKAAAPPPAAQVDMMHPGEDGGEYAADPELDLSSAFDVPAFLRRQEG